MAGLGPHVPGVAPTCPSSAYPGGESALGLPAPVGSPPGRRGPAGRRRKEQRPAGAGAGPVRVGSGPGERARGLAEPGQSAPRHVRSAGGGKRRARGGRAAAVPPSRPRRLRPGLRWALGAGPAAGRRPRAAAAAAARGRIDGKGRGSCQRVAGPLRWRNLLFLPRLAGALLSLSLSLTLSLPGWKFPLTSREKTDRRTPARTQRGREVGSPPGVGEARASGGAVRPRPGLAAQLGSRPSGPLRDPRLGARVRRPGRPGALRSSRFPAGAPEAPGAGADGDAPLEAPAGPNCPGRQAARRRRLSGCRSLAVQSPTDRPKHLKGMMGRPGAKLAVYKKKSHLYIPVNLSRLHGNLATD